MPTITKLFSMQEIAKHNSQNDCWVLIDGKVYDVTSYLDDHPGGDEVLILATGKDATEEFEDAGHSAEAREIMKDYCIGELDPSASVSEEKNATETRSLARSLSFMNNYKQSLYWVVPVAIAGVAVFVSWVYLKKK